jgi:hypothetical protein
MTGGRLASQLVLKSRAKYLNIAQNAEALEELRLLLDAFVHRPLYMYNMFITFTKVAAFLMISQFLAPLAPVIDSGG